ncbi:GNAT family N-acetyltransferase [Rathayibacter oskolensis]|uniref:GNAT family N-acetyltransferase n=1 Tax=Rathayibacter oskolensis TaxID=1891671 RepID=UPI00265FAAF9|nr:GNAT family N-acetyltransferase [Rathayibacter oskolensis]WKK71198.1 GNAT family N-acetyltransferase [Rathayibacter oskolensis]
MDWSIEDVAWTHPAAEELRAAQRRELDERYGSDDHEPGQAPSAEDVPVFVVARDSGGEAVACGGLRPLDDSVLGPGSIEVKRMFVAPGARGSGVSTAVLRALEERARARGAARLVLEDGHAAAGRDPLLLARGLCADPAVRGLRGVRSVGLLRARAVGRAGRCGPAEDTARNHPSADVDARAEVGAGTTSVPPSASCGGTVEETTASSIGWAVVPAGRVRPGRPGRRVGCRPAPSPLGRSSSRGRLKSRVCEA